MRKKGWEERGPKAHSKNSDFLGGRFRFFLFLLGGYESRTVSKTPPWPDATLVFEFFVYCCFGSGGGWHPQKEICNFH